MTSNDSASLLRTYRGNCHCGAFVYEAELPEITAASECPCSICRKKGYLFVGTNSKTHFKLVKGSLESLSEYTFGTKALHHKFCSHCGTAVLATVPTVQAPGKDIYLNVHAIQGINTWTLERTPIDGTKIGNPYEEPKHTGPLPAVEVEGGQLYTGSCHCGKLTIAAVIKTLEDDRDSGMIECNCSICERVRPITTPPPCLFPQPPRPPLTISFFFFSPSECLSVGVPQNRAGGAVRQGRGYCAVPLQPRGAGQAVLQDVRRQHEQSGQREDDGRRGGRQNAGRGRGAAGQGASDHGASPHHTPGECADATRRGPEQAARKEVGRGKVDCAAVRESVGLVGGFDDEVGVI
ncbi:Centromere protein V [Beauveria bassiana D1-5]|uniref:Centromere protein V n=1 Tax=Beauveria bassiana D1-5 TaxID=1245745 RepID=A0A0A2VX17_BEABA|nr:Centromere protein V [Beauveria bassiana D1-5]